MKRVRTSASATSGPARTGRTIAAVTAATVASVLLFGAPAIAAPAPAGPAAAAPGDESCRAIPVEADGPLGTAEVRDRFGVDGTGVTVGIISDSFGLDTAITSPAQDVELGVLPGPGNPCGYEEPVEVLSDTGVGGDSDEGRAMAQMVHGLAPGATLLFHDRGDASPGVVAAIEALAEAGADIIVDDISDAEPFFQQGPIGVTIERVKAEYGLTYLTSAGNENTVATDDASAAGRPIASWMTDEYRPTECPEWVTVPEGADALDCLDFAPSEESDPTSTIWLNELMADTEAGELTLFWGEPLLGVVSDFLLQLYATDGEERTLVTESSSGAEYGFPTADLFLEGPLADGAYDLVVVRTQEAEDGWLPAVRWQQTLGSGYLWDVEYAESTETDTVGPVTYGHQADGSAIAVGAAEWTTPDELRDYSSIGPATLLYEPAVSATPADPLPEPLTLSAPQIVSVDGTRTSFFGAVSEEDDETVYRFDGTSAAAPNAAGVLALSRQFAPSTLGVDLEDLVTTSGAVVENPYAEYGFADEDVVGAGLLYAPFLFEQLPTPPVEWVRPYYVDATTVEVDWNEVPGVDEYLVQLFRGGDTLVDDQRVPGDRVAAAFDGLIPDMDYRVAVYTVNARGELSDGVYSDFFATPPPDAPTTAPPAPPASALTAANQGGLGTTGAVVQAGSRVTVLGLADREWVYGYAYSTPVGLGWSWTGPVTGPGAATFTVPANTTNGSHRLAVLTPGGGLIGWIAFTVTGGVTPGGRGSGDGGDGGAKRLAATGSDSAATSAVSLLGVGLLALGSVALAGTAVLRRRRG